MVADSGARLLVADATTVDPARAVVAGLEDALGRRRRGAPERTGAAARGPGRAGAPRRDRPTTTLAAGRGDRPAPARDPESLAVLLYTSGASGSSAGGDAQPPRPARQHRAGGPGRAADGGSRRRRLRRAAALPRLRPQRRARAGGAPARHPRGRRRLRRRGVPRRTSRVRRSRSCRWRRRCSPTGATVGTCASGSPAYGCCCRGPRRSTPTCSTEFGHALGRRRCTRATA